MTATIDLQIASNAPHIPSEADVITWCTLALAEKSSPSEISLRVVDSEESTELNQQYRHKTGPTNILSFPYEGPTHPEISLLGDLVICAPLLAQEAAAQHKLLTAHWAHIVIHGCLHLLGYDHEQEKEALIMENKEIALLAKLGFPDPYALSHHGE